MENINFKAVNDNLLKSSVELALLNRLFENQNISEEIYFKVKESIVRDYGLNKVEI